MGGTIDEPTDIADEQHTTEEEGAPVAAEVDGPVELAGRMGVRGTTG